MAVTTSIVDYLKSQGQDSSYSARKKLAEQAGIQNYTGTAAQNTSLLKQLQSGSLNQSQQTTNSPTTTSPSPVTTSPVVNNSPTTTTPTKTYQSTFVPTELTSHYKDKMTSNEDNFEISDITNRYKDELYDVENNRPDAYSSAYESTINEILDTIKNRGQFDVSTDANYNALYDQYKERYQVQADKAMRDTLASANAATGGYGSTYGQVAAQQAYDTMMQGLNDNNSKLLSLAYQMYSDDRANDYNMLAAYQGQDNIMYDRYRDTVSDWQADRNYYANQYQQNYANDRSAFENDRSYYANQYWNSFQNDRSAYENDRAFDYGMDQDALNREDTQYQNAMNAALGLAQSGLPVPSYLTDAIDQYNAKNGLSGDSASKLAQIAAQAVALKNTKSSGSGKTSSGSSGGSSGSSKSNTSSGSNGSSLLLNNAAEGISNSNIGNQTNTGSSSNPYFTWNQNKFGVDSEDNATGWVTVDGRPGRMTWDELYDEVDSGNVIERKVNGKYYYIDKDKWESYGSTQAERLKAFAASISK